MRGGWNRRRQKRNNFESRRVHELFFLSIFSGTEKQHVANDYAKRLHIGQVECQVTVM